MTVRASDVRFRGQSGHPLGLDECLLMTHNGLEQDAMVVINRVVRSRAVGAKKQKIGCL
jgi:hypothetical protein